LGIVPHFKLLRYFFAVSLVKKRDGSIAPIGCYRIHLHGPRAHKYMAITTTKSNKGWHSRWFYIKNYDAPLPLFTSRTTLAAPPLWSWGPVEKKKRLAPLLGAIAYLKGPSLCDTGVIGVYHSRRVAPLMVCMLPLYEMVPGTWIEGMALAQGSLQDLEIQQHIREALDEPDAVFLVEGHPVSTSRPPLHVSLLS
jgi:hypothetical protein